MAARTHGRLAASLAAILLLTACGEGGQGLFAARNAGTDFDTSGAGTGETRLVERDVEAPEVYQANGDGLWDGRPSLGGVWVAAADVDDPERVIIRNEANGKFVIGALFRRERDNPGPPLQISSDAAAALDMLAGAPAPLNITALRRQEVPIAAEGGSPAPLEAPEQIATTTLEEAPADDADAVDIAGSAAAAIAEAEVQAEGIQDVAAATAGGPPAAPPVQASSLAKPYIQIGLFSVQGNADRTGANLRGEGIMPVIREETSSGKTYWRVVVGPARNGAERAALLRKVKSLGFSDAYFVNS